MFFWVDGNETGNELWRILKDDDGDRALAKAINFSRNINIARHMLKAEVISNGAKIILDGGDDLLFWLDDSTQIDASLLQRIYHEQTGSSCKIARGETLRMVAEEMRELKNITSP